MDNWGADPKMEVHSRFRGRGTDGDFEVLISFSAAAAASELSMKY